MTNSNITGFKKRFEHATARLPEQGHVHTRQMTGGHGRVVNILSGLDEVSTSQSPTETVGAQHKKTKLAAGQSIDAFAKIRVWADDVLRDGLREIDARRDQKADLRQQHPLAPEYRAEFRSLSQARKLEEVGRLIDENNGPLLAAILNAQVPELLSGVNATMAQQFTQAFYEKHAPEELAEQKLLMETYESLIGATREADKIAQAYSDPEGLAAIERGEQAAAAAAAKFAHATI